MAMTPVLAIFTLLVVTATLLPLSRKQHWIVRGMDFPRLQIAIAAALLLPALAVFGDWSGPALWLMLAATLACLGWQLWWILPYTPLWRTEVGSADGTDPSRELRILISNVYKPNRNAATLLDLVREHRPDVLVTLESDLWWQEQLETLADEMPHGLKCPLDNLYGMHLYSRLPLHEAEIRFLVEEDIPSMHCQLELRSGDRVRMHFLHPTPPSPTENEESEERDVELVVVARSVADSTQPVVVTGDLNDVAWSATTRLFRKISGLLDPRVGRGMFNTFHARYPFLRWPLDHLFHSSHFRLLSLRRLPPIGSDHFALLSRLAFVPSAPGANGESDAPDPDADDRSRAGELAEQRAVSKRDVPQPGE